MSNTKKDKKMCEQYQGWTNRETWAAALWINNEQGIYEQVLDYTETTREEHKEDGGARGCLAESIENYITELLDMANVFENGGLLVMSQDIGSLYRVEWYEIAESFLSEVNA